MTDREMNNEIRDKAIAHLTDARRHFAQQQEAEPLSELSPGELLAPLVFIDGIGAGRKSPAECHNGVSYIQYAGRTYWPLSEHDHRSLLAACCGRGQFDGPQEDELAKDAARYRWLRKGNIDDIAVVRGLGAIDYGMSGVAYTYSEEIDGDDLDSAIDAAMRKEGK